MAPLRWGIYSAGKISYDFAVALKVLPEADHVVVAVASRSEERSAKFAQTHSIPRHYGTYEQLAADAEVNTACSVVIIGLYRLHKMRNLMSETTSANMPIQC